jgi:hypothetical protein
MKTVQHQFVEFIPEAIDEGILYVSIPYATAVHKCVCGCGNEVVTPLSPKDWQLTFNGKAVSLSPSIGNWNFACRSHYWIKNNHIEHSDSSEKEYTGSKKGKNNKSIYYHKTKILNMFKRHHGRK